MAIMDNKSEPMVEIDQIDTRYELYRLPNRKQEKDLLSLIQRQGVTRPFKVISKGDRYILLDGFKTYRCALSLKIAIVPITIIGKSEEEGILTFLRISNTNPLHMLEEAKLVDELYNVYKLNVRTIAFDLDRSVGWVSARIGIIKEISIYAQEQVFRGNIPVSSIMYTLRQFKRLNKLSNSKIDEFIKIVSGKNLSCREIDKLAHTWFHGTEEVKRQVKEGDLAWTLERSKVNTSVEISSPDTEDRIIHDLKIVRKYMGRIIYKLPLMPKPNSIMASLDILAEGLDDQIARFREVLSSLGVLKNDRP